MANTNNTATLTVNGNTVTADLATIAALLGITELATETALETAPAKTAKPAKGKAKGKAKAEFQAKAEKTRAKHDAILDTSRVERMTTTALNKFTAAGFEVKTRKQGAWVWVYPTGKSSGKGRTPDFKAVKLAKGWNYSPKRGAFYRDFS